MWILWLQFFSLTKKNVNLIFECLCGLLQSLTLRLSLSLCLCLTGLSQCTVSCTRTLPGVPPRLSSRGDRLLDWYPRPDSLPRYLTGRRDQCLVFRACARMRAASVHIHTRARMCVRVLQQWQQRRTASDVLFLNLGCCAARPFGHFLPDWCLDFLRALTQGQCRGRRHPPRVARKGAGSIKASQAISRAFLVVKIIACNFRFVFSYSAILIECAVYACIPAFGQLYFIHFVHLMFKIILIVFHFNGLRIVLLGHSWKGVCLWTWGNDFIQGMLMNIGCASIISKDSGYI